LSRFPVAFRLPAFASRSSDSRRGVGPSSRSAYRTRCVSGPRRGYRVPHARATTGLGALSTPRTTVLTPVGAVLQPASAVFSTASPCTPPQHPTVRGSPSRGINKSSSNPPVRSSPRLWPPDGTGDPRAFPRASNPADRSRTTHVGEGTGDRARTWNNAHITSDEPPTSCSLVSCDLASHPAKEVRSLSLSTHLLGSKAGVRSKRARFCRPASTRRRPDGMQQPGKCAERRDTRSFD